MLPCRLILMKPALGPASSLKIKKKKKGFFSVCPSSLPTRVNGWKAPQKLRKQNKSFLNFFLCVCNSRLIWRMLFVFGGQGNIEASQWQIYFSELKLEIERERSCTHTELGCLELRMHCHQGESEWWPWQFVRFFRLFGSFAIRAQ